MNKVFLIGRLTRNPDVKHVSDGTAVANFTLAVRRPSSGQDGKKDADFIDIVVWRKQAESCATYLHKGQQVAVEGRLQIRSYETQDGQKRRATEVVADRVEFLGAPKQAEQQSSQAAEDADLDLPPF